MLKKIVLISFLVCMASVTILAQGLPFFSSYSFTDPRSSLFQVGNSHNGNLAILIPFRFPKELELGSNSDFSKSNDPMAGIQIFSPVIPFSTSNPYRNPEGNFDVRPERSNATLLSYQPNVTYVYYRNGFTLDLGLSIGMSLNQGSNGYVDVAESKVRIKYRLNRNLFSFIKNSRWELFLQLSELHRFESSDYTNRFNTSIRAQEPSRTNFVGRQVYVTPGISISNSNITFEGMVKVPINAREAGRTLDELWAPEIQGNLGLKYYMPVTPSRTNQ
ncbi:hypothetical protein CH354_14800 [Leptospira levettii]|uniref:hypothetical protein n=1 Tax=Leptospira levettii TaxID=2023178 RepID=UPI000C29BE2A|nr:hypothetical protein [Leptospira levettii]MCW7473046.1 hypothetical protein [Leptospira levettii]PJZ36349.1 hypothetical protein CH354_14800 [Leptospira levettii]PJZ87067.1 hypothetical protein CH368_18725 [Leptospira levettii]PJZ99110.1 hypothetical protein CH369_17055 [Leptospira levettii]